jgi:hypothetical protein
MTQPAERSSLYDRLGGVYSIATVVDDFIDRVMTDARLNANPLVDEAHHRVPPAGFKYLATEMVCWATGGRFTQFGHLYATLKVVKTFAVFNGGLACSPRV